MAGLSKFHDLHPSLNNLDGAINNAKEHLTEAFSKTEDGFLDKFQVCVDQIEIYSGKLLSKRREAIVLDKYSIVSGKYLYDVFYLRDPYHAYCRATDVKPFDGKHIHKQEEEEENMNPNIEQLDEENDIVEEEDLDSEEDDI